MIAVFVQGSPVWLLKRTMQWPLSNRQSTQFAETAMPEPVIKLETFLNILKAEPNRGPGILNTSFNQGKACCCVQ